MASFEELGIKIQAGKVRGTAICPQCDSTRQHHKGTKCLTWNDEPNNRWYKCHHCNWSGNLDVMDKYNQVQEKSRMPKQIASTYSKEVREYWDRRGIDMRHPLADKVFEFTMAGKPIIGFPTYMSLTLVDVKYLDIRWKKGQDSPKWWNMKKEFGTRTLPWGIDKISFEEGQPKIVTWTEGHVDRLTWIQCGYKNILSVPSGAPSVKAENFEHEFDYLNDPYVKSVLADVELHILATDGDEAGIKLRNHMAIILGKDKCKFVNYPIGYKDSNQVYQGENKDDKKLPALGKAGIDELYKNLSSFPIKGIIRLYDVREELNQYRKNGFVPGLKCGHDFIDKLYTTKEGRLQVVTGNAGSGKSTYVRWHLAELIRNNSDLDLKFGMFTPENCPMAREYVKICEVVAGQHYREGWKNSMSNEVKEKTERFVAKHFFIISPDRRNFDPFNGKIREDKINTLSAICEYIAYLKKTENIFGYVIDAWNKIEHEQPKNMTETNYISSQLDVLLDFNKYYNLHGIVIAHPTKIEKAGYNYRMPCLNDIKGSSAWREKSELGIIVHRNENKRLPNHEIPENAEDDDKYTIDPDAPTIVRTERIKFEEEGTKGRVKLKMDYKKGGRFELFKEEQPKPIETANKLNPKPKDDDDDEVFGKKDMGDLPF